MNRHFYKISMMYVIIMLLIGASVTPIIGADFSKTIDENNNILDNIDKNNQVEIKIHYFRPNGIIEDEIKIIDKEESLNLQEKLNKLYEKDKSRQEIFFDQLDILKKMDILTDDFDIINTQDNGILEHLVYFHGAGLTLTIGSHSITHFIPIIRHLIKFGADIALISMGLFHLVDIYKPFQEDIQITSEIVLTFALIDFIGVVVDINDRCFYCPHILGYGVSKEVYKTVIAEWPKISDL